MKKAQVNYSKHLSLKIEILHINELKLNQYQYRPFKLYSILALITYYVRDNNIFPLIILFFVGPLIRIHKYTKWLNAYFKNWNNVMGFLGYCQGKFYL